MVESWVIGINRAKIRSFQGLCEARATRPLRSLRQNSDRSRCRAFHRGRRPRTHPKLVDGASVMSVKAELGWPMMLGAATAAKVRLIV